MTKKSKPAVQQQQQSSLDDDDPPDYLPTNIPDTSFVAVSDDSAYKPWVCLYPIYFDSNRPIGKGRRVPGKLAVPHPLVNSIVEAVQQLKLPCFFEPQKKHPRNWDNPGRVRVQLKVEGKPVDPLVPTHKELIRRVALLMPEIQARNSAEWPPRYSPAAPSGLLKETAGASASASSSAAAATTAPASTASSATAAHTRQKKSRKGRR